MAVTRHVERAEDAHHRQRQGTFQLLVARSIFFASSYAVSALLARRLGPAAYGVYGVIVSQLLWLEMVVHAGIPTATSKLMADGKHDAADVERSARTLLLGLSIALAVAGWLLAPGIADLMQIPDGDWLFRIALLDLPFAALFVSYEGMLYGSRRYAVLAKAVAAYGLFKVATVASLAMFGFSIGRALLAMVGASFAASLLVGLWHPLRGRRVSWQTIRDLGRLARPLAFCLISGQVLINLDLWTLKGFWTGSGVVVGEYVASLNVAKALAVIPTVQAGVLFSSVAWATASRDTDQAVRHIRQASRFAIVIAAGACVIIGMNGSEILALLFSRAYVDGQRFLMLHLLGFALFALLDVFANALMATGRQVLVATVLTATLPLIWLSNSVLIPSIGPVGAALSLLVGVAIATAVTGTLTVRHFGAPVRTRTLIRVIGACVVVGLASAVVDVGGPLVLVKVAALGIIFIFTLYWSGEVTLRDLGLQRGTPAAS